MKMKTPNQRFRKSIPLAAALVSVFTLSLSAPHAMALGIEGWTLRKNAKSMDSMLKNTRGTIADLVAISDEAELEKTLGALATLIHQKKAFDEAGAIYDGLIARGDLRSTLIAAGLMVDICEQIPQSSYGLSKELKNFPDALCDRAVKLLDHPDPIVQAMGEWALALRVKKQDSTTRRVDEQFSRGFSKAAWYQTWKARGADTNIQDDYARQLVMLNQHRTVAGVVAAVTANENSLRKMLADPTSQQIDPALLTNYNGVAGKVRDYVNGSNPDLAMAHRGYLALRTAARPLIEAARPDYPSEGFVFYTNPGLTGGDWNVNVPVTNVTNIPEGDLYVLRTANPTDTAKPLLPKELGDGSVRGLDLVWEGDKLLFSYWHQPITGEAPLGWALDGNAAIYEMSLDGTDLRQLTNPIGYNDIQPCFLPDGGYMFASDRSSYGNQCAGPILQNKRCTTLFRLDPGRSSDPYAISNNKDFDLFPHVLNDGTVVFTHWEYQERGLYTSHNVWRCRPDGTNMDAYYKQHISTPFSMRDTQQIPGSELHIATIQGHHDAMSGPLVLLNPSLGINNPAAMWMLTPGCTEIEGGEGPAGEQLVPEGGVPNRGGSYVNPFPMSEKAFLVGADFTRSQSEYAIYYIDVWGNRELLYKDDDMSCFMPHALRPRDRPPVVADTVRHEETYATAFLEDVYRDLPGVEKGAVKYLRMSQSLMLPAPLFEEGAESTTGKGYNHLHYLPGDATARHFGHWQWSPSRMIGLIEVEPDGSAYFKVPAGTPVYLQALAEDFTEVRRMRTSFTLQRGEFRSCTGCHESRLETVGNRRPLPRAMLTRGPQTPVPAPWGETVLDFEHDIQPILDRNCVSCHSQEDPAGGLELSDRKIAGFAQSYRAMFGLKPNDPTPVKELDWHLVLNPDAEGADYILKRDADKIFQKMQTNDWPNQLISISDRMGDSAITQPNEFGSGQSKLIRTLIDDSMHRQEVRSKMTDEEWLALVTWVDYNAIYNGTLFDVSNYKETGKFIRVPYDLPSVWTPADINPTFHNVADNRDRVATDGGKL